MVGSLDLPKSDVVLRQMAQVLDRKNRVEYEAREFTEKEAEEIRQQSTRVLHWIESALSS